MPFKSKSQIAKMSELEKAGKVKKGTVQKWLGETKDAKKLPERTTPKRARVASIADIKKLSNRFGVK